jgi:hypothetical protein
MSAQVYLVNVDSPRQGGTSAYTDGTPIKKSNDFINWNHLTKPRLPSYIPFQISMHVCDRNIPNNITD